VEHKAQYHPGHEEFLCLDGRFTFDGVDWFVPGSYVHFPPRTVHGASVQVPGGRAAPNAPRRPPVPSPADENVT
jgi:hypothetical protein